MGPPRSAALATLACAVGLGLAACGDDEPREARRVKLGHIESGIATLANVSDGTTVTIDRAD